ncbi:MAG: hypothetical protein QM742_08660 [Aquabacterium sp.]
MLVGAGLPGAYAGPAEEGLPARNLLVEWRVNGLSQAQKQQAGIRSGQIIVDSRGQIVGRTGIGVSRIETENSTDSVQQVQVINGGRARLFVGETQPHLLWQWAWVDATAGGPAGRGSLGVIGPSGGGVGGSSPGTQVNGVQPRLGAQTVWIDVGQGLYVRPRWPGGRSPVMVELEAEAREPVMAGGVRSSRLEPDGQTRRTEVSSTLSVPLNEWTTVARSGSKVARAQSGVLSTRELDGTESQQLEIRITAP